MIKVNTGVWLDRICRGLVVAAMLSAFSACAARRTPAVQDNLNANNTIKVKNISDVPTAKLASNKGGQHGEFQWRARSRNMVAPGYEIELINPTDAQLNGRFRIRFDSVLELPYQIRVDASGLSEAQLKQKIMSAYANFFQTAPTMQINVVDKRYFVDVRGLVNKPGQYLVREDSSLDELVADAGGLQASLSKDPNAGAAARFVRVTQGEQSTVVNLADYYSGTMSLMPRWSGGEVLFFQSERGDAATTVINSGYVQMLGQVRSPGEYPYREGSDFFYYIVRAGGPTDRADLTRVQVLRNDGAGENFESYNLVDPEDRSRMPKIKGGDILMVSADNDTPTERRTRIWSQIASIVTSMATVVILAATL